ncbi:MAG: tetratricopeptide repeat protein, partial [Thermodesulfobacteriota bacterium]
MPNMIRTVRNMLRHLGYQHTMEAEDGVSAWKVLKNNKIDFVIADWNMPNMTGIALLRKVRLDSDFRDIPFLMVTAEVAEEIVAEAAETEVDGYIIKPFVAKILGEKIKTILEKRNNPSEVDTCLKLGNVYFKSGMLDNALKEYEKALKVNPNSSRVHCALGSVFQEQGKTDQAEKSYKKAVEHGSKYLKAHEGLARVYEIKGEKDKAITAMKEAVKISPKNSER